ncbi:aldehyde dehydrogenase family protein [Pseudarthrobacter siccitolerans]|uniref:aldehyde dehydrogenase family protein n=1 Tax=Pseudarthrobacter siccitolerans TaxID=861266 RepID=UPI0006799880|nr:aldehyde dehydrogenase family protein [Pseudarthrobacter siccitolerans]
MQTIERDSFFIDGTWRAAESDRSYDVISPRSEERAGCFPVASREDIDGPVAAARKAFDEGPWPRLSPAERAEYSVASRQEARSVRTNWRRTSPSVDEYLQSRTISMDPGAVMPEEVTRGVRRGG